METLKHDCLTDDVEFGDFQIFHFQINCGLCASSLRTVVDRGIFDSCSHKPISNVNFHQRAHSNDDLQNHQ